jgi:hypothetical protein
MKHLINPKYVYEIKEMIKHHLYNHETSLNLDSRLFIEENISNDFIYSGSAFRLFLFENEYSVNKSIDENCSWSCSIKGINSFYENYDKDFQWNLNVSELWQADIIGISINDLIFELNDRYNSNIKESFKKEEEILALSINKLESTKYF